MVRRIWDVTLTVRDLVRAVHFLSGNFGAPLEIRIPRLRWL